MPSTKSRQTRDFSEPVPAGARDEIGRLARGFNRLLRTLQRSEEQQRRLVQDAAHELRTPLTSVTANIEWLMRVPDLDPDTRVATLASVRRELDELNNVMAEIIELATTDAPPPAEPAPTDLALVARDCVKRFTSRTGRNVRGRFRSTIVMGDPDLLARAIDNLLTNADKYSPDGHPISVQVNASGIFVDDAGPGIPAEERELVFDRFYRRTEDRSVPGSGLGLSIVAGIVDQHHGAVTVTDSPLGGARVGFSVPVPDVTRRRATALA